MTDFSNVTKINFRNSEFPLGTLNINDVLSHLRINKDSVDMSVSGDTLIIMEKTGTKGSDYEYPSWDDEDDMEDFNDEPVASQMNGDEILRELGKLTGRKEVTFENGRLVEKKDPQTVKLEQLADLLGLTVERTEAVVSYLKEML